MNRKWVGPALLGLATMACSSKTTNNVGKSLDVSVNAIDGDDGGHSTIEVDATDASGNPGTGPVKLFSDYGNLNGSGSNQTTVTMANGVATATLDCTADATHCIAPNMHVIAAWEGFESESGDGKGELPPAAVDTSVPTVANGCPAPTGTCGSCSGNATPKPGCTTPDCQWSFNMQFPESISSKASHGIIVIKASIGVANFVPGGTKVLAGEYNCKLTSGTACTFIIPNVDNSDSGTYGIYAFYSFASDKAYYGRGFFSSPLPNPVAIPMVVAATDLPPVCQ